YQADHVRANATFGLILGNYRVTDRLGAGGMGVVYKAEHLYLRRPVAIKVLSQFPDDSPSLLDRFFTEMRTVARLQHPNIVAALDAGTFTGKDLDHPDLHFLVMEYVAGQNLDQLVPREGL